MNITNNGLKIIGLLVTVLWGCVITERAIVRDARAERAQVMQQLRHLRQAPATPACTPRPMPWSGDISHRSES